MSEPIEQTRDIDTLSPHPRNYNQHPPAQIERLAASLRQFGQVRPIVAHGTTIIAGHGVYLAAQHLGYTSLRVTHLPDDWTEEQALAYLVADNETRRGAEPDDAELAALLDELQQADFDIAAMGFDEAEYDALLDGLTPELPDPGNGGDEFEPDEAAPCRVQPGDVWLLGGVHRLICGDCTDPATAERLMQGERADMVFTSPPYAVGVDYGETYEDTIDNLRLMLSKVATLWRNVVVPGGFAVINFGDIAPARNITKVNDVCEYPMALEYWPVFRDAGWYLHSRRIWCKPNARVHSPWCIQSNRAATDWEHIWTWRNPGASAIVQRTEGEYRSALGWIDTSLMHGVDIGKQTHGAGMALGIAEWMVTVHSRSGAIILEPFTGSGTTIIAAHRTGRRCYGCEISEAYCEVILQRCEAEGLTVEKVEA